MNRSEMEVLLKNNPKTKVKILDLDFESSNLDTEFWKDVSRILEEEKKYRFL